MLGSTALVNGASHFSQHPDSFSVAWHTAAGAALLSPDASPASPRLFGSPDLPQTPPSQMLRVASVPPPVRRLRNNTSPPHASHPTLSSALTVACTLVPESCQSPGRLPTQRQLGFSFTNPTPAPQASPFAAAAVSTEPPTLLDKINSLPGPKNVLRTVLTQNKNSLSLQDRGMLTHMLHRATLLQTASECHGCGSTSTGSACRYKSIPNDCMQSLISSPQQIVFATYAQTVGLTLPCFVVALLCSSAMPCQARPSKGMNLMHYQAETAFISRHMLPTVAAYQGYLQTAKILLSSCATYVQFAWPV